MHRLFDRSAQFPVVQIAGSHVTLPVERHFGSIAAVQSYVEAVLALNWVGRQWPRATIPVRVRRRAGQRSAHYERTGSVIAVPEGDGDWAMRELVVLHELAHHLGPDDEVSHGAGFVDRLLTLIGEIIGPEAAFVLRVTLLDVGISG